MKNTKQGFATMDPEKQREIASKGGKTVAANKEHMSAIGSKGGKNVAKNREHMAEIGRKGGKATQKKNLQKRTEELMKDVIHEFNDVYNFPGR